MGKKYHLTGRSKIVGDLEINCLLNIIILCTKVTFTAKLNGISAISQIEYIKYTVKISSSSKDIRVWQSLRAFLKSDWNNRQDDKS